MATACACMRLTKIYNYVILGNASRTLLQRWPAVRFATSGTKLESQNTDEQGKPNGSAESPGSPASDQTANVGMEELIKEKDVLSERIKELDDKYKRALAETENVRQRMQRQIQDAKLFGIQGFCKDLLEVADILQKATTSVPQEELNEKNPHLRNLYEGLQMTETQLQKVFRSNGLVQINPVGDKFDPNFHEALFEQVFNGKEPGTVAIVTKIGYKLHERTIRPALVGVVKAAS